MSQRGCEDMVGHCFWELAFPTTHYAGRDGRAEPYAGVSALVLISHVSLCKPDAN